MEQIQILIKPASSACDLRCRYCFYRDEASHRKEGNLGKMEPQVMDEIIEKGLSCAQNVVFAFQGGEPTLAGLEFFRTFAKTVEEKRKNGQKVSYTIQTNGYVIDDEWISFFRKNRFLVGVSLDGVRKTHDENRLSSDGSGTFEKVFENIKKMQKQQVDVNVLCVLNRQTAEKIEAIYRFFMRKGLYYQQYIPCLDPLDRERGKENYSLPPKLYADALKRLFDLWFEDKRAGNLVYIRQFDNYLHVLRGGTPEACTMYGKCSMQNVVEADGSVYPCDFYALDTYRMGNIKETDFAALQEQASREEEGTFFENPARRDDRCPSCRWYPLCRGGCKRDCEEQAGTVRNYYCEVYTEFFEYAIGRLEWLAENRYV
ncbi:anaerobic sulfatase maturase [Sellimonas sp.]|uniref:anaerobic sulfatase maturase n=1 Tax=Sellimonas sp. TaxID=2021466 RepID=UPI00257C1074|nr:anaerobic sulfatase maturase [Sellimonas sp.]